MLQRARLSSATAIDDDDDVDDLESSDSDGDSDDDVAILLSCTRELPHDTVPKMCEEEHDETWVPSFYALPIREP